MRRLFVPRALIGAGPLVLPPADLHYLRHVLRLGPGAPVEVFDGEGGTYAAVVAREGDALLIAERRQGAQRPARIQLAFALARGERCDLVVQKATELGVARLQPFLAERSVVRLDAARGEDRARRWQRIATEAARQSERADVPTVDAPAPLGSVLATAADGARVVVLHARGGEPLADTLDPSAPAHLLVVGPEGGLTADELRACSDRGARLASLGPRILRFETAAIAATALVQHLAGDLGAGRGRARDASGS